MFPQLPSFVKAHIMKLASAFPAVLQKMLSLQASGVPSASWTFFMRSDPMNGKAQGGGGGSSSHNMWHSREIPAKAEGEGKRSELLYSGALKATYTHFIEAIGG